MPIIAPLPYFNEYRGHRSILSTLILQWFFFQKKEFSITFQVGWPDDLEKIAQFFWKVAQTVAKQNNAKLETILNGLFRWKFIKFVAQGIAIFGLFL
jgi:hypothetical protein